MLQIRLFLTALQRYSRLPVSARLARWVGHEPAWQAPADRYFPAVGLVVAALSAIVYAACGLVLPHPVALLAAMAAGLMLTGACHEQGLAGWSDTLGAPGAGIRSARPTPGSLGVTGLVMVLLARFQSLAAIDPSWIGVLLVSAAALSRGCALGVMASLPRPEPASAPAPGTAAGHALSPEDAAVALVLALAPVALAALWTGELSVFTMGTACAIGVTAWMRRHLRRHPIDGQIGGLGAVQQLAELAFLIGALAMLAAGTESGALEAPAADNVE